MKKIMILNGAGKRNGRTAKLVAAFREGAESAGNEVVEFYLHGMDIKGCIECQGCKRKEKGDPAPCVQKDDMQQIYDVYRDCDVVAFASSMYWFSITGELKTAVDRLYAIQNNLGFGESSRETVLLMTAGGDMYDQPLGWYSWFSRMGWPDLGRVLGAGKEDEARAMGAAIG